MPIEAELSVDYGRCSGHGRCYATAPDLFEPDDDEGRGHVIAQPSPEQMETARRASQNCPEQAITLGQPNTDTEEKE